MGSGENQLSGSEMAVFSLYPHLAEAGKELSGGVFSKSTDLIQAAPISGSKHFPKGSLLLPSHWVLGFPQNNWEDILIIIAAAFLS